jgi:uroporphyrinogen decarboxylase
MMGAVSELSKRVRLEAAFAGEQVDRPPVALWQHWPGDDRAPQGLAEAVLRFEREFDFDFCKVTPASSYCVEDWGTRDEWRGNTEGTRDYTFRPVQEPEDWQKLAVLDPTQGTLGDQLECLKLIGSELGETTPFIQTIFNPLSQAKNLAGNERMLLHMRRYPEALRAGLETVTESTIRFIEQVRDVGAAGIFYAVQHARYDMLCEDEYRTFGVPYDLRVLEALDGLWLNVLHLHGDEVMFDLLAGYPVQVLNWHDREAGPSLADGLRRCSMAVCGGLARDATMVRGTPEQVRAQATDAYEQTGGKRFVLGTGCVVPIIAPRGNVRAVRRVVDEWA